MKANLVVVTLLDLGLTQMEIEHRTGVDQTTVSCIKRGVRKRVSYEIVVALDSLLGAVQREAAAGTLAFECGRPFDSNPHELGSVEANDWDRGFKAAERKAAAAVEHG